jgi:hypothetical protein
MSNYKKTYVRYFVQEDRKTGLPVVDANGNPSYDPKNDFDRECYLTEEDVERLYGTHTNKDGNVIQNKMTPDRKVYVLKESEQPESLTLEAIEAMTDEELKAKAKEFKVKSSHTMGREKLIESLTAFVKEV